MHVADITMFHAPTSGGVRTYLQAKHRRLAQLPDIEASLLIPGGEAMQLGGLHTLPAPRLPFGQGYRFPVRRRQWSDALARLQPDLIEAGDPYVTAWSALDAYRAAFALCCSHWLLRYSVLYLVIDGLGESTDWAWTFLVQMLAMAAGQLSLVPVGSERTASALLVPLIGKHTTAAAILTWRFVTYTCRPVRRCSWLCWPVAPCCVGSSATTSDFPT